MKVIVTKGFKFSPDGNQVVDIEPGAVVEGRCAEVALKSGWGHEDTPAPKKPDAEASPVESTEEKAVEEAPHHKAHAKAPHNKTHFRK